MLIRKPENKVNDDVYEGKENISAEAAMKDELNEVKIER